MDLVLAAGVALAAVASSPLVVVTRGEPPVTFDAGRLLAAVQTYVVAGETRLAEGDPSASAPDDGCAEARAAAREGDAAAAVWLDWSRPTGTPRATVSVAPLDGPCDLARRAGVAFDEADPAYFYRLVALKLGSMLRELRLEAGFEAAASPEGAAASGPPDTEAVRPWRGAVIAAARAVVAPRAGGVLPGLGAGVAWRAGEAVALSLELVGCGTTSPLRRDPLAASVYAIAARAWAAWRLPGPGPLTGSVAAGGGVLLTIARGESTTGYEGGTEEATSGYVGARAGLALRVAGRVELEVDVLAGVLRPAVDLRLAGRALGGVGPLLLELSLGAALARDG